MKIDRIKIGERFRKDFGDLSELKKSIEEVGLLHPIVITENNELVAGHRRLLSFKELGRTDIPVNKINITNMIKGEHDENTVRKDWTPSEKIAIGEVMNKPLGGRGKTMTESVRVKKEKILGWGHDTYTKAKQVVESERPELVEKMNKTGNVNAAYKKLKAIKIKK